MDIPAGCAKGRRAHPPTPARRDAHVTVQGRSERSGESYSALYVEPLSDARTLLADFFHILLEGFGPVPMIMARLILMSAPLS